MTHTDFARLLRRLSLAKAFHIPVALCLGLSVACAANTRDQAPSTSGGKAVAESTYELNYDDTIPLDAESLAESGMVENYNEVMEIFKQRGINLEPIEERVDYELERYEVFFKGREYEIYSNANDYESWGKATFAFFYIINSQLQNHEKRFYALYGGNDLHGILLTPEEREKACASLEKKTEWPYLPTNEPDWYGAPH